MKWIIASDIHGSAEYCRRLLEFFDREGADRLLLLGDLLYHGPRNDLPTGHGPKEVMRLLNERRDRITAVRGNCDAEVDQTVLEFPILSDYALLTHGQRLVYATHGHRWSPERLPLLHPGEIFMYGHTHIPCHETVRGVLCLNPGSVSIPKGGSPHSCMIWTEEGFDWVDLETGEHYDTLPCAPTAQA